MRVPQWMALEQNEWMLVGHAWQTNNSACDTCKYNMRNVDCVLQSTPDECPALPELRQAANEVKQEMQ